MALEQLERFGAPDRRALTRSFVADDGRLPDGLGQAPGVIAALADAITGVVRTAPAAAPRRPSRRGRFLTALFPGYLSRSQPDSEEAMKSLELCASIVDTQLDAMTVRSGPALYGGWAGMGWLTTHLEAEDDFVGEHVDRLLVKALGNWRGHSG